MLLMLFGSVFFFEIMLAPIQIIWIGILVSEYAEKALITEIPDHLLKTKPRNLNDPLISEQMWRNIIFWPVC